MLCANVMRTDFVAWFGAEEPLCVETIFMMSILYLSLFCLS